MAHPPEASPIAFLSDVHGNLTALEVVLAELERLDVKRVYVAGDLLLGGDEPLEVWQRLQALGATCTRGPSDSALGSVDPGSLVPIDEEQRRQARLFSKTRGAIGDLVAERLRRLPEQQRVPLVDGREILMVHGSPADSNREISHDLSDDEVLALLDDDPADIIVCGSTHVPFQRAVAEYHIVNVGSVGAAPEGQVAHYTVVTPRMSSADILQDWISYEEPEAS
ncbi:MAG: metallophosphoesterase family protein [Deltaproteobacteria bacterium]|jgi:predicted phosphodiesterase|nr:metallophosphoesterase family protein [Deltaproteobacteria bacterium]MBW2211152.1 metallophosphoesterase family protein [Deltaproteobacteria bacterium]MBW2213641.1 metallophosphoesterase family protein [Deltaproteobacteria bacterium]MBW2379093.1 metallophosphoesterase family protein [Deltaproteobacteria bacterium]MBW2550702.1 metallophosphoesterase family protein [Deltaproteobacteria bacterium]